MSFSRFHLAVWISLMAVCQAVEKEAVDVQDLIRQLSDEDFKVRERATLALWELGDKAKAPLEAAASSSDPEAAIRAREVARKIHLDITPGTDPSIVSIVEDYAVASAPERLTLLGKLRGKRAWRQMLKLYQTETDAMVRERMETIMGTVALLAARERILEGDETSAREYLEMAPANAGGLAALADFHRSHGTLAAELERAKGLEGAKGAAWRMALHAAAGNLEEARNEAQAAGEVQRAAIFSAMAGDPLPALRLELLNADDNPLRAAYAKIAIKRWQDQKVLTTDLNALKQSLDSGDEVAVYGALFLLGENKMAEQMMEKTQSFAAFIHFDSLERIPEALKAIGIDADKPDYKAWVSKRFEAALDVDIEDQHGVSDGEAMLWALANFMERRGLHAEALDAFAGPMEALAEKNDMRFVEILQKLFRETSAPRLARTLALNWAGNDDERWDEVVTAAFGEDDAVTDWWTWLAEINPDSARAERLHAMLALFGVCPDVDDLRGKWLPLIWRALDAAEGKEKQTLALRIYEWATNTDPGDVEVANRAWDALDDEAGRTVFFGRQLYNFSASDRWNDAAELIARQMAVMKDAKQEPGAELHAYAAATLRMAGKEKDALVHDKWVDKLTLGKPEAAFQVANGYAFGRDYSRAQEWWRRALILSEPQRNDLGDRLKFHADQMLEIRQLKEAAALFELQALQSVGTDLIYSNNMQLMRSRQLSDTARALHGLSSNRARSLALLHQSHNLYASDGSLADFFFPAVREAGLIEQHDIWFNDSWRKLQSVISRFPEADNVRNTAAWFASRAMRELDQAEKHVRKAMELRPRQSAFLDTMAEIHFARGRRSTALKWSNLAINHTPMDSILRRQHERFRSAPFPK